MSDFLYLVVPCAIFLVMGAGSAPETLDDDKPYDYYGPKFMDYNDETYRILNDTWDQMEVEGSHGEKFVYDKNTKQWTKNGNVVDPGRLGLDDPSRFY